MNLYLALCSLIAQPPSTSGHALHSKLGGLRIELFWDEKG